MRLLFLCLLLIWAAVAQAQNRCAYGSKCETCPGTEAYSSSCQCVKLDPAFNVTCPPGKFCEIIRGSGTTLPPQDCPAGFYCPGNTSQPVHCCEGFYCPTPTQIVRCPAGYFCTKGQIAPRECAIVNPCPAGSSRQVPAGAIILLFIVVLVLLFLFYLFGYIRKNEQSERSDDMKAFVEERKRNESAPEKKVDIDDPNNRNFNLEFDNIGLTLPNGVTIMQGVTGTLQAGRTAAVMGPSGAGKSTLFSLISGKVKRSTGTVLINGQEDELSKYKKLVGFVPQEDIMLRTLTVHDILQFSADLRLPADWTSEQRSTKVQEVIDFLGMSHVMESVVGDEETRGISGGQRKRVNIGMELVAEPRVLFLDEPTSGLDSSTSFQLCRLLKRIAHEKGLTVAAVIHSPSPTAFREFDDLILLGKGGRLIYMGPRAEASAYFASIGFPVPADENPADFFMDVATGAIPRQGDPNFAPPDLFEFWLQHVEKKQNKNSMEVDEKKGSFFVKRNGDAPAVAVGQGACSKTTNKVKNGFISWWHDVAAMFEDFGSELASIFSCGTDPVRKTVNVFFVFLFCLRRALAQLYRNPVTFFSQNILHVCCGLFISIVAKNAEYVARLPTSLCASVPLVLQPVCNLPIKDNYSQTANFMCWGIGFAGIAAGSSTFGSEKVVFWRDSSAGMSTVPYFLAKMFADVPRITAAAFFFTCAFFVNFVSRSNFGNIFILIWMLYWTGFSQGYFVSSLFSQQNSSLVGVIFAMVWAIVFSGAQTKLPEVYNDFPAAVNWLWDISGPRWGLEAFYVDQLQSMTYADIQPSLNQFGYQIDNWSKCIINIFLIGLLWQGIALFVMKVTNRDKKK
eukprot:TRINITY_DN4890_c0_g8_i2.p1 TRINITY_DN4890_c0_g8~~TRINITY_DN4890_c0_g8_i2.p1  ORF type:complete len:849 (+),score=265.43 TRINITY_DN4890_c0_g8_i2:115-2661(+)